MSDDEERIRIHCTNCGALLKAKMKYAGKALKCPRCKTVNMVPYTINEGDVDAPQVESAPPTNPAGAAGIRPLDGGIVLKPKARILGKVPEIDNLMRSIFRCFEDGFERGQNILSDVGLNNEKKEMELMRARRDLTAAMRMALINSHKKLEEKVEKLRNHPLAASASVKAELEQAEADLEGFRLFAKCFFDFRPGAALQGGGGQQPGGK